MNFKKSLLIGCLTTLLGIGAAVGAAASAEKAPVRADAVDAGTDIYITKDSSISDSFFNYGIIALWNHQSSSFEQFSYDSDSGYYKVTLASACTSFNVFRGASASWDDKWNQSGDSSFSGNNNLIYVNSWPSDSSPIGFEWRTYTAPVDPSSTKNTYYVYDSEGVLGDTLANIKIYGFASGVKPMSWPGDPVASHSVPGVSHVYRAQLSVSYTSIIINNGTKQTADVTDASSHAGDVLYIENNEYETNKYTYKWVSLDDLTVTDGTYLRGDWTNGWSVSGQETMELNPGNPNEVMVEGIDLGAGGKVKVVTYSNHLPTWRSPSSVDTQDENYPVSTDGDNNAVVEKTGTYNIYVNFNTWAYWFNPTANVDLEKATAFATAFNTAIEGKCTYQGGSPIGPLTTEWGNQGTEYAKLSEGAKEILKKATTSHTVAAIGTFAGKYDYVYGKYGYDNDWTDFAERTPAEINAVTPVLPGLTNATENNAWIWITVSIAVAGLGVGAFFFIKRRKEDR